MPIEDPLLISLLEEFLELKIAEEVAEITGWQTERLKRLTDTVHDVFRPIMFKENSE